MPRAAPPAHLFALSFDRAATPSLSLRAGEGGAAHPIGWGLAWYPAEQHAAQVVKDPASIAGDSAIRMLAEWERLRSHLVVGQLRRASLTAVHENTQPFARSYAGREWICLVDGELRGDLDVILPLGPRPLFEPLGRTAAERAFCWLLTALREQGARRLADVEWRGLHTWLQHLERAGAAQVLLADGDDLVVHQDHECTNCLHWARRRPPQPPEPSESAGVTLSLRGSDDHSRTFVGVSTIPFSGGDWRPMYGGQTLVARRGAVLYDTHAGPAPAAGEAPPLLGRRHEPRARRLCVVHETVYRYTQPVKRSSHSFRLRPVVDETQRLLDYRLYLSVEGHRHALEDVFGNHVLRLEVERPFTELRIESASIVELSAPPPLDLEGPGRVTLPLVWMPWQRRMMDSYLLPPELPEAELVELSRYAMAFALRQDFDLVETLADINATIHRDFEYVIGSTTVDTTPFEVYESRRGVCQDFTNLFICMARLLGIPARYRTGYIHTGADYANRVQSEASHAWAELYVPDVGWRGFDPTNGCLTGVDHVRTACGRHHRDAAPTSGTIYAGGGGETLTVAVRVEEVPD